MSKFQRYKQKTAMKVLIGKEPPKTDSKNILKDKSIVGYDRYKKIQDNTAINGVSYFSSTIFLLFLVKLRIELSNLRIVT